METTDFIGEFGREHRNRAVWKIDAGAPDIRLVVQGRLFPDIVTDIRDRNIELDASLSFSFNGDGVIEISRIFSIDGKGRNPSQVNSVSAFM